MNLVITRVNNICIDDVNWLDSTDATLAYELDCAYDSISSINIMDAVLHFATKVDQYTWENNGYVRVDCNGETERWSSLRLNYTFTTQNECDRYTYRVAGFRKGVKCNISKNFLRSTMFRTNRFILETRNDIFPVPYSFQIRYACN